MGNFFWSHTKKIVQQLAGKFITTNSSPYDWRDPQNDNLWQDNIVIPEGFIYNEITSPTGRVWMDRNLGASQVATSSTDSAAYGDLYQWGRTNDGHEKRNSETTTELNDGSADAPIGTSDWRVPNEFEWEKERLKWTTNDAAGAFSSILKLPVASYRFENDGEFWTDVGTYWSRSIDTTECKYLYFYNNGGSIQSSRRARGYSLRLIKEDITLYPRWDYHSEEVKGLDTFGFNALPGGDRTEFGSFIILGTWGFWWSDTELDSNHAWLRSINYGDTNSNVNRRDNTKKFGFSVRLVRDYVTGDGTKEDGRILQGTFSDADGNTYNGVIIGDQVWSTSNLKTTSYADGTAITAELNNTDWSNTTSGAYAVYPYTDVTGIDSEAEMVAYYGRLYNWYAVADVKGLSNDGHVPSDTEWTQLTNYLINNYNEVETTFPDGNTATDIDSTNVGKHLKSIRTASI